MTSTTGATTKEQSTMHVKVAIVGAGASGLMCAHKLLNNGSIKLEH